MSLFDRLSVFQCALSGRGIFVSFFLGILFIGVKKMIKSKEFKDNIISMKRHKGELITHVNKYVDATYYLSKKLISDKEIIGNFNTETAILALNAVKKIEGVLDKLHILEDTKLQNLIKQYHTDTKYVFSSIYNIEKDIYNKMLESEKLLVGFNREFDRLIRAPSNEEEIALVKQAFKSELSGYRTKIKQLEQTYSTHRNELELALHNQIKTGEDIMTYLNVHQKRHVETKKLFIKKLVYA